MSSAASNDVAPTNDHFWAVIPAGGAGTRLWPVSRAGSPKFLHDLTGSGRSLLQATWDRLTPLTGARVLVVTGVAHRAAVGEQLPDLPPDQLLAEPAPRDSMAAIGWAAAVLEARDPDAVLGSFAADHVITDEDAFRACVAEAVRVAEQGFVVTIGIEPTHPATGFGYIEMGSPLGDGPTTAVSQFVEKPDRARAQDYLSTGRFRWNAGMFVVKATVLLDLLAQWHPELAAGVRALAADPGRLEEVWPGLEKIAIDHAVAEPAAGQGRVAMVPGGFGWDDVGDFSSLGGLLSDASGMPGVRVLGDASAVRVVDSTGIVVPGTGRVVALVGLDDVVVVDTPDALLVMSRERAQDVKAVVDALRSEGRADLL
ncbi:mannose-1-phosphate guanylyltransferase [Phycicoccus badiiscoriae]|uniref:Mannose-1-phosphate guanylyltransferase n=1 Tax=Pedococcus badiiscoriae TaxID=642776 RepID=A0A852WQS4_9MICO|nr:mannose-1-phosphate guanylyltransferase [Pedococcus badiiscoriae]NYG07572.1 mannose-1-phosphate guanylyltransferase [Pedococcus badiiscoriae]